MLTNLLLFWAGIATLAFSVAMILYRQTRKELRQANKYFDDQVHKTTEASIRYNRQLDVRHDAIKKLLTNYYAPETLTFFAHLVDPSSHIPDNIFEKVDSYQGFIMRKKKE